jgi:hypothetical protein
MKEQDYINVSDLTRIREIKHLMQNIIPENSEVILRLDYENMSNLLHKWDVEICKRIKIGSR